MRGGTITINFYDPDGHLLDYRRVEELAGAAAHLAADRLLLQSRARARSAEGLTESDMLAAIASDVRHDAAAFPQLIQHRGGKSAGAIRVSLGLVSNFADVDAFLEFAAGFRDQTRLTIGEVTFDIESCRVIRDGS